MLLFQFQGVVRGLAALAPPGIGWKGKFLDPVFSYYIVETVVKPLPSTQLSDEKLRTGGA